jgi:hypothetical protein
MVGGVSQTHTFNQASSPDRAQVRNEPGEDLVRVRLAEVDEGDAFSEWRGRWRQSLRLLLSTFRSVSLRVVRHV